MELAPTSAAVESPKPPASKSPSAARLSYLSWPRIVLLVALLNAPLFFNGCDTKQVRLTAGAAIPFAELATREGPGVSLVSVNWWSWWRCAANLALVTLVVWLATSRIRWMARLAQSRVFLGILIVVALVFNAWFFWPWLWGHAVFNPTLQLWSLVLTPFGGLSQASETTQRFTLLLSARLYYVACVAGLTGGFFGLRVFLRRYFFVQSGRWWQVQLRGLIVVMVVLGALIGMVVRLLTWQ